MDINLDPFWLSIKVGLIATLLVVLIGIPFAYLLAKKRLPGHDLIVASTMLPIILPPTVLGYYLLVLLGRNSFAGTLYESVFGSSLVFTWQGAVIAAAVASSPFLVRTALSAIQAVPSELEDAARTLGLSETKIAFKITLPLAWKGILAGIVLAFAKVVGEFGATLMIAGNIPGETQTLSIAIYDAVQAGKGDLANILAVSLSVIAIIAILLVGKLEKAKF